MTISSTTKSLSRLVTRSRRRGRPGNAIWADYLQGAMQDTEAPAGPWEAINHDTGYNSGNIKDSSDFVLGTQAMSFRSDGAGTAALIRRTVNVLDLSEAMLRVVLKAQNIDNIAQIAIDIGSNRGAGGGILDELIRLGGGGGSIGGLGASQKYLIEDEWIEITIPFAGHHVTCFDDDGSGTIRANLGHIDAIGVRMVDVGGSLAAGDRPILHVNRIEFVKAPSEFRKGIFLFTADDSLATQYNPMSRILDEFGYGCTAYTICTAIDNGLAVPSRLTLAQMRELQDFKGWDFGFHAFDATPNSANALSWTEVESAARLAEDIEMGQEWLVKHGFKAHRHGAYVKGEFNIAGDPTNALRVAERYFETCRTVADWSPETWPPGHPHLLRSRSIGRSDDMNQVLDQISSAARGRYVYISTFHTIDNAEPTDISITEQKLRDICQRVQDENMAVMNIGEFYERFSQYVAPQAVDRETVINVDAATTSALPTYTASDALTSTTRRTRCPEGWELVDEANAGTAGVYAPRSKRLVATANGAFPAIDGFTAAVGNRYFVQSESGPLRRNHGVYELKVLGDASTPWELMRVPELTSFAEFDGAFIWIRQGTIGYDTLYKITQPLSKRLIDSDELLFVKEIFL